jgi:hypothetical protein
MHRNSILLYIVTVTQLRVNSLRETAIHGRRYNIGVRYTINQRSTPSLLGHAGHCDLIRDT